MATGPPGVAGTSRVSGVVAARSSRSRLIGSEERRYRHPPPPLLLTWCRVSQRHEITLSSMSSRAVSCVPATTVLERTVCLRWSRGVIVSWEGEERPSPRPWRARDDSPLPWLYLTPSRRCWGEVGAIPHLFAGRGPRVHTGTGSSFRPNAMSGRSGTITQTARCDPPGRQLALYSVVPIRQFQLMGHRLSYPAATLRRYGRSSRRVPRPPSLVQQ